MTARLGVSDSMSRMLMPIILHINSDRCMIQSSEIMIRRNTMDLFENMDLPTLDLSKCAHTEY